MGVDNKSEYDQSSLQVHVKLHLNEKSSIVYRAHVKVTYLIRRVVAYFATSPLSTRKKSHLRHIIQLTRNCLHIHSII